MGFNEGHICICFVSEAIFLNLIKLCFYAYKMFDRHQIVDLSIHAVS